MSRPICKKRSRNNYGLRCVETLTGFKYIGAKLGKYERALARGVAREISRSCAKKKRARCVWQHSSFYVFGGEESYGYSGADFVRDKDGNGAAIMFCEVAAYAKSQGLTIDALLDEIYADVRLFRGEKRLADFRRRGRRGENQAPARILRRAVRPTEMLGAQSRRREKLRDRNISATSKATRFRRRKC